MRRVSSILLVGTAMLMAANNPATALTGPSPDLYAYEVLIDTDSNDATGCDVDAEDDNFTGPVPGIEYVLRGSVRRFPTSAEVDVVVLIKCVAGVLEFDQEISAGDWPAGLENGINGADIVELRLPRAAIGDPPSMALGFHSTRARFNDVLLTTDGQNDGEQIIFAPPPRENVPVLSSLALGLGVLLLLTVAWFSIRRHHGMQATVATLSLVASLTATAWAVTIALDGAVGDWAAVPPIAMDQINDSTADDPAEDFVAAFATADASNLYFRVDVVNLAPTVCGNGVVESGEDCESDVDCGWIETQDTKSGGGAGDFECDGCECNPD